MRSERGFTLLEVMIATAILSIAVVSAMQLFSGSMRLAGESARQTRALVVARSVLDEALWRADLEENSSSGDEGVYHWTLDVFPVDRQLLGQNEEAGSDESKDTEFALWEIRATVDWVGPTGPKQLQLSTARIAEAFF